MEMYLQGYKFCTRCRAFYYTDGIRCPNCGAILRTRPRKKNAWPHRPAIKPSEEVLREAEKVRVKVKRKEEPSLLPLPPKS